MKLIIDIPDYNLDDIQNGSIACGQVLKAVKNGKPYEETTSGDLISRSALKDKLKERYYNGGLGIVTAIELIDNAPTVEAIVNTIEARPKGDIFPMEIVAGKCPIEFGGNCPLKPKGEWYYSIDKESENV